MTFGEKLKTLRTVMGITQRELSEKLHVKRATIAGYETGRSEPDFRKLKSLSEIFNVSIDYLLGNEEYALSQSQKIPLLDLSQGLQQTIEYVTIDIGPEKKNLFALRMRDNHLAPRIMKGDIVIIREEKEYENGDYVLALRGDSHIISPILFVEDKIVFTFTNSPQGEMDPQFYTKDEIQLIGKIIEVRSKF